MKRSKAIIVTVYEDVWKEIEKLIEAPEEFPKTYVNSLILERMLEVYKQHDGGKLKLNLTKVVE